MNQYPKHKPQREIQVALPRLMPYGCANSYEWLHELLQ